MGAAAGGIMSIVGDATSMVGNMVGGIYQYKQDKNQQNFEEAAFNAEQQNQENVANYNRDLANRQAKEVDAQTSENRNVHVPRMNAPYPFSAHC